jgi:hypothetical protein
VLGVGNVGNSKSNTVVTRSKCTMLKAVACYRVIEFDNCEIKNVLLLRIGHQSKMQDDCKVIDRNEPATHTIPTSLVGKNASGRKECCVECYLGLCGRRSLISNTDRF